MSIDLLIGLVIVLATLVQAFGSLRKQRRPKPPGRSSTRPEQTAPRQTQTQLAEPQQAKAQDDSFSRRLEEARRRVQEAMAGTEAPASTPPKQTAGDGGTLFPEKPLPDIAEGQRRELEESRPDKRLFEGAAERLAERREDRQLLSAPPLRVQRTSRRKTAKLSRDELIRLDAKSIYQGVIWHQILSDPLAKRQSRRQPSRRP